MSAGAQMAQGKSLIASALAQSAVAVRETRPNAWTAELSSGTHLRARADAGAEWLVLEVSVAGSAEQTLLLDAWDCLRWHARFEGAVKLALSPPATALWLRVDIPLDDEEAVVAARVPESCAALARAARAIAGAKSNGFGASTDSSEKTWIGGGEWTPTARSDVRFDLAPLCTEAGWAFAERDGSRLSVDLGIERRPAHALLEPMRDGGARARVEIVRRAGLTSASRVGLGAFLLAASGSVRLARAYVHEAADHVAAGFEVLCASPPTVGEIGHALSSLSVANALFGLEARALAEDRVARAYLAVHGPARGAARLVPDTAGEQEDRSQALVR